MNLLRKLRERTVAKPKPIEQSATIREVPAAKTWKKTNKLRTAFRQKAVNYQDEEAIPGKFTPWSVASSIANKFTEESIKQKKNVFSRIKDALKPQRSKKTRSCRQGAGHGDSSSPSSSAPSSEISAPVFAPSVPCSSEEICNAAASDSSTSFDAETLSTIQSKFLSDLSGTGSSSDVSDASRKTVNTSYQPGASKSVPQLREHTIKSSITKEIFFSDAPVSVVESAPEEATVEEVAVKQSATKISLVVEDTVTEEPLIAKITGDEFFVETAEKQSSVVWNLDEEAFKDPVAVVIDASAADRIEACLESIRASPPCLVSKTVMMEFSRQESTSSDAPVVGHNVNESFMQEATHPVAPILMQAAETLEERRWRTFGSVSQISHEAIIRLVAEKLDDLTAIKVTDMKCGSFNCVYFILCDSGETILLRVPSVARQGLWHDEDAKMMVSDFRTTNFIGEMVDFGVPEMLTYDVGFDNAIQAPHIFESFIPGKPLYQVQREWEAQGTYREKNARAMKQLGAALAQLCQPDLQFGEMGMLDFDDDDGSNPRVGPTYVENPLDLGLSMPVKRLGPEREIQERLYPLKTSRAFFCDSLHRNGHWDVEATSLKLAYQRIIALGLDLIPKSKLYLHEEKECFGLRHPDLDKQNMLFDDEGNLQGIIDWSGTLATPNFLSCASMPKFLVKDFTPWIPMPLYPQNDFELAELAEQRQQFEASFTESLVGQTGAGYLRKSPWFAAFERGINDFEWEEGKPVGRRNFVDKLFAMHPKLDKSALLDYLANTGDEWPTYIEYYKEMTGIDWPRGDIDVKAVLRWMISIAFDCEEPEVPRYYGIGYNGPLTADMESNLESDMTREDAVEMLSKLQRNKVREINLLGGEENYNKYKNELRHRIGRSDYLDHLAKISNEQGAEHNRCSHPASQSAGSSPIHAAATSGPVGYQGRTAANAVADTSGPLGYQGRAAANAEVDTSGPIGYQGRAAANAEAEVPKHELLAAYQGTLSQDGENIFRYQGRKPVEPVHEESMPEDPDFGSIMSIDHKNVSQLVMRLVSKANPEDARVIGTAHGSFNFVYLIEVVGGDFHGLKMVLRIPANGREGLWTESNRKELTSQALTMLYIKNNTDVPIPMVYFYNGTLQNEINAPFILMGYTSGKSLRDCMVTW